MHVYNVPSCTSSSTYRIYDSVCACSGLSADIYVTNGSEACWYVLNHCQANIVIVEDQKQLDKILQVSIESLQLCTV